VNLKSEVVNMSTKFLEEKEVMNRIELIALFSALSKFLAKEDYESVKEIVNEVLEAARKDK